MLHTYEAALDWLAARHKFGIKPGLDRMHYMLNKLNHPERRLKAVHIAGTNGKGSTLTFMKQILIEAGYTVGTFTSPYIERFNERISVNGEQISDEDIVALINKLKPIVEETERSPFGAPTEFEVVTVMAFEYFANYASLDLVLFEVGLGGTYDSTNVIHPLVSIITNVSLDHMDILGDTLEAIATEKAGIIKNGVPIITAAQKPAARSVIEKVAKNKGAKLYRYGQEYGTNNHELQAGREKFTFKSPFGHELELVSSMLGDHQIINAATAVMAVQYLTIYYAFHVEEHHIINGTQAAFWPARFEEVANDPVVILDGAHNEAGILSLIDTVQTHYQDKKVHLLFAALESKETKNMTALLEEFAHTITYTSFAYPRALSAQTLWEHHESSKASYHESWDKAFTKVMNHAGREDIVIITGSLYFLAEVRKKLTNGGI